MVVEVYVRVKVCLPFFVYVRVINSSHYGLNRETLRKCRRSQVVKTRWPRQNLRRQRVFLTAR